MFLKKIYTMVFNKMTFVYIIYGLLFIDYLMVYHEDSFIGLFYSINPSVLILLLQSLLLVLPLLIAVAYTTLLERKVMSAMQRRLGPSVVGQFGLLQALADGLKLFLKETILPLNSNLFIFVISPILTFFLSLITWAVIPFSPSMVLVDLDLGILYILSVSSLGVYGVVMSGWSSNSKYAFLGALRSTAQLISYEISISLILLNVLVFVGSLNISTVVSAQEYIWFVVPLLPLAIIFFISGLAETNRAPFDLPEAEAELVAGYNVEYSSMVFALFFLGEYAHMILMSTLFSIFFLGGWSGIFFNSILVLSLKIVLGLFAFVWVRAAFPRYRYDQLMALGWLYFLPITFAYLLVNVCFFLMVL